MHRSLPPNGAADRLAAVLVSRNGVVYFRGTLPGTDDAGLCLAGDCRTGEIFVQVTRGEQRWVEAFASRVPFCRPAERRAGILWPDLAVAFALAERLRRKAHRRHRVHP